MEKRRCVLCQAEEGTLNHLIGECVATSRESIRVEEIVTGKNKLESGGMVKRLGKKEQ